MALATVSVLPGPAQPMATTTPVGFIYEPSAYPAGSSLAGQMNPLSRTVWQAGSAPGVPITVRSGSLNLPGLDESGANAIQVSAQVGQPGPNCRLPLAGLVSSNNIQFSVLLKVEDATTLSASGISVLGLNSDTAPLIGPRLMARSTGAGYNLGLIKSSGPGGAAFWDNQVFAPGEVVCVAVAYTFVDGPSNDVARAWIFRQEVPDLEQASPAASLITAVGPDAPSLTDLVIWQNAMAATSKVSFLLDRILVAPNWLFPRLIFGRDYGDAPIGYPVTAAEEGASHSYSSMLKLGSRRDLESSGNHSPAADYDDSHGAYGFTWGSIPTDDEDGVNIYGTTGTIRVGVTTSVNYGYLDAWVDFNRDRDWDDADEQIVRSVRLDPGETTFYITVPAGITSGDFVSRWRYSETGGLSPTNYGGKGEVEDHLILNWRCEDCTETNVFDFGDAPDDGVTYQFHTLLTNDGASHAYSSLRLGTNWDAELDGQPSLDALLDDTTSFPDDEDGVHPMSFVFDSDPAATNYVAVFVTGGTGRLDVWMDWDGNHLWDDSAEEHVINGAPVYAGWNYLRVTTPAVANGARHARFRLSSAGTPLPSGLAADGEVEDYLVEVVYGSGSDSIPNQNPRGLRMERDGALLRLSWEAVGAILEEAGSLDGPWTEVPQAASPLTIMPNAPQKFFRLNQALP